MYINEHVFASTIQLKRDMNSAIEGCNSLTRSGQDLPTKLKIASISTRFNNLKHDGDKLLVIFVTKPIDTTPQRRNSKAKSKRSDSASASELAIKQTLANLQSTFTSYKKAFERRLVSHRTSGQVATSESRKQSESSGVIPGAVRLRTKSEVKPSVPVETSPSRTRNMAGENHIGPRPRTHTADQQPDSPSDKDKSPSHNVVKDKVASFNKRAQEEEQIHMPNVGITFDVRPRARTADPSVGREGKGGVSPRHRATVKAVPEKPELEKEAKTTKAEESSVDVASVPLRRNRGRGRGGLSKDERRQKIAAIRELFETSDLSNIVSEPGRQWKPTHLPDHSPAKRLSVETVRKMSEDSSSVLTQNSSLESGSGTSLSESGQPAFTSSASSMDNEKPATSVDQQVPAATAKSPENKPEESKVKLATSGQTNSTTCNGTASTAREQAVSPSVLVSPPAETRTRLYTAPAVYKTVVKDLSDKKQQVRTLNIEQTPTPALNQAPLKAKPAHPQRETGKLSPDIPVFKGGSLERNFVPDQSNFMRDTRATRSMSPQQRRHLEKGNSQSQQSTLPGRTRRPPLLQVAGKVSSLRSMFDSQAQAQTNSTTFSPFIRKRASSESKPYQVRPTQPSKLKTAEKSAHQRSSSMDTTRVEKAPRPVPSVIHQRSSSMDTPTHKKLPTPVQEEPSPPPTQAEVKRGKSPDIIPITRPAPRRPPPPPPKESPLTTSITESSSPHPPPRPPSPVGYLLEKEGESDSELESESEGSIYESDTSSLDEVDLEWVGGEDDVDLPYGFDDSDLPLAEQRMFKSLR